MRAGFIVAALAGLLATAPALAQEQPLGLDERSLQMIRNSPERAMQQHLQQLFQIAPDGELTEADVDLHVRRQLAELRANELRGLLRFDLDGDMAVSEAEISLLMTSILASDRVMTRMATATCRPRNWRRQPRQMARTRSRNDCQRTGAGFWPLTKTATGP